MALSKNDLSQITKIVKSEVKSEIGPIKKDLKNFATKDDLANQAKVFIKLFVTKQEFEAKFQELNDKIANIPNKNELFDRLDGLTKELKDFREAQKIIGPKISDHEDRIKSLEDIHPAGQHISL